MRGRKAGQKPKPGKRRKATAVRARNEAFMTLLKRHRLALGLTLKELAAAIGVTPAAVQAWETGRWEPKPKYIPVLAKTLGVTPMEITLILSPDRELVSAR
jgi:transcriptional regulator with XRE-family HTH domain